MAHKIYIVWCKLNKATPKFDVGIYINKARADKKARKWICSVYKIWVSEYKLPKVYKDKLFNRGYNGKGIL